MEEEQNIEELQERERSIRQLESDIVDVNTIFKDLATMVHEQGEMIDSIEQVCDEKNCNAFPVSSCILNIWSFLWKSLGHGGLPPTLTMLAL